MPTPSHTHQRLKQLKAKSAILNANMSGITIPTAIKSPGDPICVISHVLTNGLINPLIIDTSNGRSWEMLMRAAIEAGAIKQPGTYICSWIHPDTREQTLDYVYRVEEDSSAPDGLEFHRGLPVQAPVNITRWPPRKI